MALEISCTIPFLVPSYNLLRGFVPPPNVSGTVGAESCLEEIGISTTVPQITSIDHSNCFQKRRRTQREPAKKALNSIRLEEEPRKLLGTCGC